MRFRTRVRERITPDLAWLRFIPGALFKSYGCGDFCLNAREEPTAVPAVQLIRTPDRLMLLRMPGRTGGEPLCLKGVTSARRSHDGKLRHASYKGLREAADQLAIYELDDIR